VANALVAQESGPDADRVEIGDTIVKKDETMVKNEAKGEE